MSVAKPNPFVLYRKLRSLLASSDIALEEQDVLALATVHRQPDARLTGIRNALFTFLLERLSRTTAKEFLQQQQKKTLDDVEQAALDKIIAQELTSLGYAEESSKKTSPDMATLQFLTNAVLKNLPPRPRDSLPRLSSAERSLSRSSSSDSAIVRAARGCLVPKQILGALERPQSAASARVSLPRLSKSPSIATATTDESVAIEATNRKQRSDAEALLEQLQQENLALKAENEKLQAEVSRMQTLINDASAPSSFRRVLLTKAKNYQLERQVIAQNTLLHRRKQLFAEVETGLSDIDGLLSEDATQKTVLVAQRAIQKLRDLVRTRWTERQTSGDDALPRELVSVFLKNTARDKLTVTDTCYGDVRSYLNLQHISALENCLALLYNDLLALNTDASVVLQSCIAVAPEAKDRVSQVLSKAVSSANVAVNALASLAVLVPAAPLPELHKVFRAGVPSLPDAPTLAAQLVEGSNVSDTLRTKLVGRCGEVLKCLNVHMSLNQVKLDVQDGEIAYHKALYARQNDFATQLVQDLQKSREALNRTVEEITAPLRELQAGLDTLKASYSNEGALQMLKTVDTTLQLTCSSLGQIPTGSSPLVPHEQDVSNVSADLSVSVSIE